MTVLSIIFTILATFAMIFGAFATLNRSVPLDQTGPVLGFEIAAALILGVLAALSAVLHWWLFGPVLLLIFGFWQLMSYTGWSWLVWAALLIISWIASGISATGGGIIQLFVSRVVFIPLAALGYIALSALSYHQDHKDDRLEEILDRVARR